MLRVNVDISPPATVLYCMPCHRSTMPIINPGLISVKRCAAIQIPHAPRDASLGSVLMKVRFGQTMA